jgi:hypothetical protein
LADVVVDSLASGLRQLHLLHTLDFTGLYMLSLAHSNLLGLFPQLDVVKLVKEYLLYQTCRACVCEADA